MTSLYAAAAIAVILAAWTVVCRSQINRLLEHLPWNDYGQRWSVWRVFDIPDKNDPSQVYLKRLRVVQTPWLGFYVHWVFLPDSDRDPHDHPWNFWSFVARGGYTETLSDRLLSSGPSQPYTKDHGRFSLHRMPVGKAHKIVGLRPNTITVLLVGRRQRDWGFWTTHGWVPWREYNAAENGPDPFMS